MYLNPYIHLNPGISVEIGIFGLFVLDIKGSKVHISAKILKVLAFRFRPKL